MVKYYDEEDYLDVNSHMPYLKDELIDKEVAEKLSKEVSSNIIEQVKHNMNNMDNSIEERAKEYAPDAIDSNYVLHARKEFIINQQRNAYIAGAKDQQYISKIFIEQLIDKACNVFCHTGCPHKRDSYDCLKDKCDTWKIFRRMMEE